MSKIGIAVPCHVEDRKFLRFFLASIKLLKPAPSIVYIEVNRGETMLNVRSDLYEKLFGLGYDVVLMCAIDFFLFPDILKFVRSDKPVCFVPLCKKRYDLTFTLYRLLLGTWTGCYSLPRVFWYKIVKPHYDGTERSVMKALKRAGYKWVIKTFAYYDLRQYQKESCVRELKPFPLWKRLLWQLLRLKVVRIE